MIIKFSIFFFTVVLLVIKYRYIEFINKISLIISQLISINMEMDLIYRKKIVSLIFELYIYFYYF